MLKLKYIREGAQAGLSNTVFEAANLIKDEAQMIAPVDTGYLRDHIETAMEVEEPTRAVAKVTSNADYSVFVEYGTRHMSAQPFMRPALDAKRVAVLDYISTNVKRAIADEVQNAHA